MARWIGGILQLDTGGITDQHVASNAALDADKMQHVYTAGTDFDFVIGDTPTAKEKIVYVAKQAGTIRGFHCLLNVDGSSTSITFDLKKNGSSILTGVVTITDSTGNRVVQDGTLSSTTLAADDVLSIAMAVSSSTGAQGPYAWVDIEENSAP